MASTNRNATDAQGSKRRSFPLGWVLGGVFTVLLIITVFLTLGDEGTAAADEYGTPSVTGAALPTLVDTLEDPAVGSVPPEAAGADFDGTDVAITDDGRPKMIVFLAHWCPHCQNEMPEVSAWVAAGGLPDTVDLYAVATSIDPSRDNYPPSAWFERESLDVPTIVDDARNTIGNAFGLNAYPFWVFVQDDGTIAARISGVLSQDDLTQIATSLADQ
ncbi:MAG: TlpA family protein disulfide reductase [Actinobacteria bacterium]|nr:TlpA family protein disulfide reductase [Actinomycetota bacterium]